MLSTLHEEDALREESARCFWNLIINATVKSIDEPSRDRRNARYKLTYPLFTLYMERGDSRIEFARRCAALDLCKEMIGALVALDSAGNGERYQPVTGGRCFLIGHCVADQTGENGFEVCKGERAACFRYG